jgi:ketosteroid isomerase-like protein
VSTEKNVQTVKDFFAAIGRGDREGVLALAEDWTFAVTVRNGRLTSIREYVDTQALALASQP